MHRDMVFTSTFLFLTSSFQQKFTLSARIKNKELCIYIYVVLNFFVVFHIRYDVKEQLPVCMYNLGIFMHFRAYFLFF